MKHVSYRLAEALERICKRKTLEHITVSEIAAEAGVTRQVFYHYFDDKFDLASGIHYVHLYQSVKQALEEKKDHIWRRISLNWLRCLEKNKALYANAFQSVSQKEFQRIIRDFFYTSFQTQLELFLKRPLTMEEKFALRSYCVGSMELICEWVSRDTQILPEQMEELLAVSMPEIIYKIVVDMKDIPFDKVINKMEVYLSETGLSQAIYREICS